MLAQHVTACVPGDFVVISRQLRVPFVATWGQQKSVVKNEGPVAIFGVNVQLAGIP